MIITPVSKELQAATGATHEVRIYASDLTETTANTAQTIQAFTVADGDLFAVISSSLVTAFQDASDVAFNTTPLTIGLTGGDVDLFLASQELNVNGTEIDYAAGAVAQGPFGYAFNAADTVDFIFGSMADKALNDIDTGELRVLVKHVSLVRSATA